MTIAIAYNGGSYGTYLEWSLTTLCSDKEIKEPFTDLGSSHKFQGNNLRNINEWRQYVNGDNIYQFVRLHPKTKRTDSITESLLEIAQNAKYIIYIYPDSKTILLNINNFFYKIWDNWIDHMFESDIDPQKIYNNWPVSKDTPLTQIPQWIVREFLSYYLMPAWFDQVEWEHSCQYPNLITIKISDLLFNFENTLLTIQQFCDLNYQKPISNILPVHKKNLDLQRHIDSDNICQTIVNSITNQIEVSWLPISLPSEAWVQWELRNRGFEMQCDGLDTFPTNSIQLRELLYPV